MVASLKMASQRQTKFGLCFVMFMFIYAPFGDVQSKIGLRYDKFVYLCFSGDP